MTNFCIQCGKENSTTNKFCIGCGKSMQQANIVVNEPMVIPKKGFKRVHLIWGGLTVLVIGVITYFLIQNKKNDANQNIANASAPQLQNTNNSNDNSSTTTYRDVEQKIRGYYETSTQGDAELLYNSYLQYCYKYYDVKGSAKDVLINDMNQYWSKVSDISQTIKNIEITNYDNKYQALVTMDYCFWSIKDQIKKYITNLKTRVILDSNYNILEVYEVSRN